MIVGDNMAYHNGAKFSTSDQNTDRTGQCIVNCGPWWNRQCCHCGLNILFSRGLNWHKFTGGIAKSSVMMIRKL